MELNIQLFASTNKTANYELPQFVGTDKPTWLGDFNSAMADIDAGMHENASDISAMASDVQTATSTASQASQNVASLTSTVSSLSSDVQSATTTANNASATASSALNTANSASTLAGTANGKADTNASDISDLQTAIANLAPVVLYSDSTGTSGSVTLSDNVSNYSYLEVYGYNNAIGGLIYTKYDVSSGQDLNLFTVGTNGTQARLVTTVYTVSGTTLTVKYTQRTTIFNKTIGEQGNNAENKITKVLGIK
jgi:outer membrane murein-binding lipoprotein Lpp